MHHISVNIDTTDSRGKLSKTHSMKEGSLMGERCSFWVFTLKMCQI